MPLEKHFSRDLLNEGAVAAEIVAETISFASIDAGSKWLPELGLPVEAVAASCNFRCCFGGRRGRQLDFLEKDEDPVQNPG